MARRASRHHRRPLRRPPTWLLARTELHRSIRRERSTAKAICVRRAVRPRPRKLEAGQLVCACCSWTAGWPALAGSPRWTSGSPRGVVSHVPKGGRRLVGEGVDPSALTARGRAYHPSPRHMSASVRRRLEGLAQPSSIAFSIAPPMPKMVHEIRWSSQRVLSRSDTFSAHCCVSIVISSPSLPGSIVFMRLSTHTEVRRGDR